LFEVELLHSLVTMNSKNCGEKTRNPEEEDNGTRYTILIEIE